MKVIPGTRQADLFGLQSIYKIGMPDEGYSRNASSGLVWLSKYL
jgi:TRAP-type C4-dicarboxylate transport system permease large subunit